MKHKNHMIISIKAEKEFDKGQVGPLPHILYKN